jgi:hypothetical protein
MMTSHDTKVEVPPLKGVKLKSDKIGVCVTEDRVAIDHLNKLMAGSLDHGPVHPTITRMRTI